MVPLMLVRHAEPTASWGEHPDPGLSPEGQRQAETVATALAQRGPAAILTSPLRRAQESAAPLARRWDAAPQIVAEVGEIPTPTRVSADRGTWLRAVLARDWSDVEPDARRWRTALLDTLRALGGPTIVFTHFVAINVAVGAANDDDRVWSCSPAHASVTEFEGDAAALTLVSLGSQSTSRIG